MPSYYFSLRTPNRIEERSERRDLANLSEALVAANGVARSAIRRGKLGSADIRGNLDVEDENRRPVARLILSEVAHQML